MAKIVTDQWMTDQSIPEDPRRPVEPDIPSPGSPEPSPEPMPAPTPWHDPGPPVRTIDLPPDSPTRGVPLEEPPPTRPIRP